jgi:hypothetical protein
VKGHFFQVADIYRTARKLRNDPRYLLANMRLGKTIEQVAGEQATFEAIYTAMHEAQVIRFDTVQAQALYDHRHQKQPYELSIRLPFNPVFFDFAEPVEVDMMKSFSQTKDKLISMILGQGGLVARCAGLGDRDDVIWCVLVYEDYEIALMVFDPKELPTFYIEGCNVSDIPQENPCYELKKQRDLEADLGLTLPGCPCNLSVRNYLPECYIHQVRVKDMNFRWHFLQNSRKLT